MKRVEKRVVFAYSYHTPFPVLVGEAFERKFKARDRNCVTARLRVSVMRMRPREN